MKTVTVKYIQNLDKIAIEGYGIPSIALMENAGRAVAEEVWTILKKNLESRVCVFCGMGNNAGDGFVIARHLLNFGIAVDVFLIGKESQLKKDALINYNILKKCRYSVKPIGEMSPWVKDRVSQADVIVDAIFGVGVCRNIENPYKEIIAFLNQTKKKIVSVDIPSGLDGTTGIPYGICIKAWKTVTFTFAKKGLFLKDGSSYSGKVMVVPIGIPRKLLKV